jgi:hypothetical protein
MHDVRKVHIARMTLLIVCEISVRHRVRIAPVDNRRCALQRMLQYLQFLDLGNNVLGDIEASTAMLGWQLCTLQKQKRYANSPAAAFERLSQAL